MTAIIVGRVFLSASASVLQKQSLARGGSVATLWQLTYGLLLLPALLVALLHAGPHTSAFWVSILCGGILDALGNLAMTMALRSADLSVFGPLNALRPILALGFAWIFLGEVPAIFGLLGVAITVAGAALLLGDGPRSGTVDRGAAVKTLLFRLVGLGLSTSGAAFLKRAAGLAPAELTLSGWVIGAAACLAVIAGMEGAFKRPVPNRPLPGNLSLLLAHVLVFALMQWLTIRIFQETLLAYSFAFFQLGMALQVVFGRFVFNESLTPRRLLGCAILLVGNGVVVWQG